MTARSFTSPSIWGPPPEELPLFAAEDLPAPTAAHIDPSRHDDAASYARTVAAGLVWYCPRRCTKAHSEVCECPCRRACHSAGHCPGHR